MAYEFKKLSEVDVVESPSDVAYVLIEEDGVVKKVAKTAVGETAEAILGKIAAVDEAEEPADDANLLIEKDGALKRVPASSVGREKADLVIRINQHPLYASTNNIEIVSGSVEAVYDVFESGVIPKVDIEVYVPATVDSYVRGGYKVSAQVVFYGDKLYINAVAGTMFGENPHAFRIIFDSTANYALTNYICQTMTTTA